MTTSKAEEQAERRRVLQNDARVREQGATFMSHTHSDAGGRFAKIGAASVIGSTAVPQYPAASAAHQIQLPDEPPLGFDNPELEPPTMPSPVEAQAGGPADAPATPLPVEHAGPSSSYRRLK
jgi:hypothetical protein